jgi:DNA-binding NarL/FixJ family response regulator
MNREPDTASHARGIRVAVWSPSKRFERALRDVIAAAGARVVEPEAVDFPALLCRSDPDVLVLDLDGSLGGSAKMIGQALQAVKGMRVVALSAYAARPFVESALNAGATGYVLKDHAFEDLPSAVRAALANTRFVSPAALNHPDGSVG